MAFSLASRDSGLAVVQRKSSRMGDDANSVKDLICGRVEADAQPKKCGRGGYVPMPQDPQRVDPQSGPAPPPIRSAVNLARHRRPTSNADLEKEELVKQEMSKAYHEARSAYKNVRASQGGEGASPATSIGGVLPAAKDENIRQGRRSVGKPSTASQIFFVGEENNVVVPQRRILKDLNGASTVVKDPDEILKDRRKAHQVSFVDPDEMAAARVHDINYDINSGENVNEIMPTNNQDLELQQMFNAIDVAAMEARAETGADFLDTTLNSNSTLATAAKAKPKVETRNILTWGLDDAAPPRTGRAMVAPPKKMQQSPLG